MGDAGGSRLPGMSRIDRPIPVPPNKHANAKPQPAVASSAPSGLVMPTKEPDPDQALKTRSSAPSVIEGPSTVDTYVAPSSPKHYIVSIPIPQLPPLTAPSSPPPLMLQGHRRKVDSPVPANSSQTAAAPYRPLPSVSPRLATSGSPAPTEPISPNGSSICERNPSGSRIRAQPFRSPRTFAVSDVTPEQLTAEAKPEEAADADRLMRLMREAKEAVAAANTHSTACTGTNPLTGVASGADSSSPPTPRRPSHTTEPRRPTSSTPTPPLSISTPVPPSASSSPPPTAYCPPLSYVPAAGVVSPTPTPTTPTGASTGVASFAVPRKTLPTAPKRAATASSITPGHQPSSPSSSNSGEIDPRPGMVRTQSTGSYTLSLSDGASSGFARRGSEDPIVSPPLSPSSSNDSVKQHAPLSQSGRSGSGSTFRKLREKAKEGFEKTAAFSKEGFAQTAATAKEGLEQAKSLRAAPVFQEIKKFGATASSRLGDIVDNFSAEEEADNAIAAQRESAQPSKVMSASEQELVARSGPLCMVLAKHNWLVARTLAGCLQREENERLAKAIGPMLNPERPPLRFLRILIDEEVTRTKEATTLFRGNSFSTAMLSVYQRCAALPYLHEVLRPLMREMLAYKHSFELNPEALKETDNLEQNKVFLEVYVDKFVATIVRSLDIYPLALRHLCRSFVDSLGTHLEAARHFVLAGFFFLRFVCPAIIAPDGYDLLEPGEVVSSLVRRNLVIVSKVLQNIANNAQFSNKKEAFMAPMNPVVLAHQPVVQAFLTEMAKPLGPPLEEPPVVSQPHPDLRGVTYLQSQLHMQVGKLQELVSTSAETNGDVLMDELMMAMAMLPPPSIPAKPPAAATIPPPAAATPPPAAIDRASG